jgi:L,D-transpeptidase YcbB
MMKRFIPRFTLAFVIIASLARCNGSAKPPVSVIAVTPEQIDPKVKDVIYSSLKFAADNNGMVDDTIRLMYTGLVNYIYTKKQFNSIWCSAEQWKPLGDSLFNFISKAKLYGLFPDDYHFRQIDSIREQFNRDHFADRRYQAWPPACG